MSAITFYNRNGRIDYVLSGDATVIETTIAVTELPYIVGSWDGATHYILDDTATERPVNTAALDLLTLQNLPVPCKIAINGTEYECNESEVQLDLPMSGLYKIKVSAFPYLDAEFRIET